MSSAEILNKTKAFHGSPGAALGVCALAVVLLAGSGCPGGQDNPDGGPDGFDDHTVQRLDSVADFEAIAAPATSSDAVKFVITPFTAGGAVRFYDSAHYKLHDEWYWFRLLNGVGVPGDPAQPPVDAGRGFDTVEDIYAWANAQVVLPDVVRFIETRLYAPRFYELALSRTPKVFGVGTVLRFPARPDLSPPRPERFAFELEHSHQLTEAELATFFERLDATLPDEVGDNLFFLARSLQHETIAQQVEDGGGPYADRMLRYDDVVVPGEVEVYSEGLTAGRIKFIRAGEPLTGTVATDVLVLEEAPDFLPPCAALITAVPQTALAHVNLLAKNRGIPNLYLGGALDDPQLDSLARVRAPVVIQAQGQSGFTLAALTETEFSRYRQLTAQTPSSVTPIDVNALPLTVDLETLPFADGPQWQVGLGGKAIGFTALLSAEDVTSTHKPLAISIKPYVEHINVTTGLGPELATALADTSFVSDARVRLLVLEGEANFLAKTPGGAPFVRDFLDSRAPNDVLLSLINRGGVRAIIEATPIAPATLQALQAALLAQFNYQPTQAMRFRSSSNVEDIEGFNGAGLYESHSGYLRASEHPDAGERGKTVERALRRTWSSYWSLEAFEERRAALVDHLSGAMGAVVHATFGDEQELANGVFTLTILPPEHASGDRFVMELNVQPGFYSVTNPPPEDDELPEIDRVSEDALGAVRVERVRPSTLMPAGAVVHDDATLLQLFGQAKRVAELWLATENARRPLSQRRSTLTLDFEHRDMARGWPALAGTNVFPRRIVVKQARTLEPSLARVPDAVRALPIPEDILARARRVERRTCATDAVAVVVTEVATDPARLPDLGYGKAPFVGFAVVDFLQDVPALGAAAGARRSAVHTAFESQTRPGMEAGGPWSLDVVVRADRVDQLGLSRVVVEENGATLRVERGDGVFSAADAACTVEVVFASPEDFLASLLAAR